MHSKEIIQKIRAQPFESFVVVTNSGDRYLVRHPENAIIVENGALYLFEPIPGADGIVEGPKVISMLHVTSLEPASRSQRKRRGQRAK